MRKTMMLPALFAGLLLISAGFARADDPKTVLEKAIAAHGGAAKLDKLKAVKMKAKGSVNISADAPFALETVWQEPDKLKNTLKMKGPKQTTTLIEAIVGDNSWSSWDGRLGRLSAVKQEELRAQAHVRQILRLTPLLVDKCYELSSLAEIRIEDRPASGIRVGCPGERDVQLYFDTATGLLAKVERRLFDDKTKKTLRREEFFSDYKNISGVPTAMKQVWLQDGKNALQMIVTEVQYPDRLDALEFADPRPFARTRDVIYGHKSGIALTMDVFAPKKGANGAAIVVIVSGGWHSDQASIDSSWFTPLIGEAVKRGYTVFTVCHGSQPRFTIPDAIADIDRAIRFIRSQCRAYRLDPNRIGVTGGSAGGHLSLMQGTAGDRGNPKAKDALARTSSRVQAVACFFPPTDFLNYGAPGQHAFVENGVLANFRTALDVRELDKRTKRLEHITDKARIESLCRRVSPIAHVSTDDPPTLIIHGDADKLVPIQQAEVMVAKLKEAGVPAELIVKKGGGHGWAGIDKDMIFIINWFDKYLTRK